MTGASEGVEMTTGAAGTAPKTFLNDEFLGLTGGYNAASFLELKNIG